MTPRVKRTRVYWRKRGGVARAYGDFRDYEDVGGRREPLVPKGELVATSDPVIAEKLATDRVSELQERRRNKVYLGVEKPAAFAEFAAYHLQQKAASKKRFTRRFLRDTQHQLQEASAFFGADRDLTSIRVADIQRFVNQLAKQKSRTRKEETLASGTIRHYLNSISNLYRRAQSEGRVPQGYNPVAALMEKPGIEKREASWLEIHDAALYLEAARIIQLEQDAWREARAVDPEGKHPLPPGGLLEIPVYPLIATYLLTGGRRREVLGLRVQDVSFERRTVTFRTHPRRRLKTPAAQRVVPLWPQIEEVLRWWIRRESKVGGSLLFSSLRLSGVSSDGMIVDPRKALDRVSARLGWKAATVRPHDLRHTWVAARLQTLDNGAPVSLYTVRTEAGHESDDLIKRIYGHLGDVRHRSEQLEFRVEQHAARLAGRLEALGA
ncbi:MAG: tyrosine-type recombinase/integrase [Actinomycetota bacterium]